MFNTSITKAEINLLPLKKYDGKIVIISNEQSMRKAAAELRDYPVLGFDTEKRPSFEKGVKNKVALVQLAVPGKVFLIRLKFTGFTRELKRIFSDEKIKKVGIGTADDIASLLELENFNPAGFIDLNKVAEELGIVNVGVRNLAAIILGLRISKTQQVTNWERLRLTDSQMNYAAVDAWACLEIYNKLNEWGYI